MIAGQDIAPVPTGHLPHKGGRIDKTKASSDHDTHV